MDGEHVAQPDLHGGAARGVHHGLLQRLAVHHGPCQRKFRQRALQFVFHLFAQFRVFPHQQDKLAHHFIPLILEQLVAALGGDKPALDAGQFHARGIDAKRRRHQASSSFLGRY